MVRALLLSTLLSASLPGLALADADVPDAREEKKVDVAELRARRAALEEERDAARMNANIYVLPRYRLEAIDKQKEIDRIDAELRAAEAEER
ncbi:hypothetical protein [Vulgatibacter incomptus]|uniref:Uncharacterized protein n=1 Tax=Vulgatibacter incomptus TaxID=1391653 RepID=A0A0K1PA54_9BACT|nr:hypothetical protein [Vulgatibacter incomptus]AKU89999.1 hypothetical protein AKJ08_0386 [Vulgatibacter incomptus]